MVSSSKHPKPSILFFAMLPHSFQFSQCQLVKLEKGGKKRKLVAERQQVKRKPCSQRATVAVCQHHSTPGNEKSSDIANDCYRLEEGVASNCRGAGCRLHTFSYFFLFAQLIWHGVGYYEIRDAGMHPASFQHPMAKRPTVNCFHYCSLCPECPSMF